MLKRFEDFNLVPKLRKVSLQGEIRHSVGPSNLRKGNRGGLGQKVIEKVPSPIPFKGVRNCLGYASFYHRFIKDFSKIAHPFSELLEKECKFYFYESCQRAFGELKGKLASSPIIISPN